MDKASRLGEGIFPSPSLQGEEEGEGHENTARLKPLRVFQGFIRSYRGSNPPAPPLILTFSPAAMAAKAKESILALLAGRGQGEGHECASLA